VILFTLTSRLRLILATNLASKWLMGAHRATGTCAHSTFGYYKHVLLAKYNTIRTDLTLIEGIKKAYVLSVLYNANICLGIKVRDTGQIVTFCGQ
jgi:hypothetical protein